MLRLQIQRTIEQKAFLAQQTVLLRHQTVLTVLLVPLVLQTVLMGLRQQTVRMVLMVLPQQMVLMVALGDGMG